MKKIKRKLKLEKLTKVYWVFLKTKILLVVQNKRFNFSPKKYILFPMKGIFTKDKNIYFLTSDKLLFFHIVILKWIDFFNKLSQKKLFLVEKISVEITKSKTNCYSVSFVF